MADEKALVASARHIADAVLKPNAGQHDREGRFSTEAIGALGEAGLLGLMVPRDFGGAGLGLRSFADVLAALTKADASVAMVYLMHVLAANTIAAAPPSEPIVDTLRAIASGWSGCSTMPRRAPSWRRRAINCTSSSARATLGMELL